MSYDKDNVNIGDDSLNVPYDSLRLSERYPTLEFVRRHLKNLENGIKFMRSHMKQCSKRMLSHGNGKYTSALTHYEDVVDFVVHG